MVSVRVKLELCFQISAKPIWRMRYSNPFNAWHKKFPFPAKITLTILNAVL